MLFVDGVDQSHHPVRWLDKEEEKSNPEPCTDLKTNIPFCTVTCFELAMKILFKKNPVVLKFFLEVGCGLFAITE